MGLGKYIVKKKVPRKVEKKTFISQKKEKYERCSHRRMQTHTKENENKKCLYLFLQTMYLMFDFSFTFLISRDTGFQKKNHAQSRKNTFLRTEIQ